VNPHANHVACTGSTPGTKKVADNARDLWKTILVRQRPPRGDGLIERVP